MILSGQRDTAIETTGIKRKEGTAIWTTIRIFR
jgi:hypothetical protein